MIVGIKDEAADIFKMEDHVDLHTEVGKHSVWLPCDCTATVTVKCHAIASRR